MASIRPQQAGPDPAQLRAIERQAQGGDVRGALDRAERLAHQFPDHSGLRSLRAECLLQLGAVLQASMLAWEWLAEHPNSVRAAHLAGAACLRAELPFLARQAARRLADLGHADPRLERESEDLCTEFAALHTGLDARTGMDLDAGLMYVRVGRYQDACEHLARVDLPLAQFNLALAHFRQGQAATARALLQPLVEATPPFLPALFSAIQYALYQGDEAGAAAAADRLAQLEPQYPEALFQQVAGLLLMERSADALGCYDRCAALAAHAPAPVQADLASAAGVACTWSGQRVRAAQLFQQAAEHAPRDPMVVANVTYIADASGRLMPFLLPAEAWLPDSSARAMLRAVAAVDKGDIAHLSANAHRMELDLPERSSYLAVMARQADPVTRIVALELLGRRAEGGEAKAVDALRALLCKRTVTMDARARAVGHLCYAGAVRQRDTLRVWLGDAERDVTMAVPSVGMVPDVPDLTREQARRHTQAQEKMVAGNMGAAVAVLEMLLREVPSRHAQLALRHELATVLRRIPGKETQADQMLAELLQAADCLPRTRAFRALLDLEAGRAEAAREQLQALTLDGAYWFFDAAALLHAWERFHQAAGDEAGRFAILCAQRGLGAFRFDAAAASAAGVPTSEGDTPNAATA